MSHPPASTSAFRRFLWRCRSLWRWLAWVGLGTVCSLLIGYAALPWLIPKSAVAGWLSRSLAESMNRSASVGTVQISWQDGIIFHDVRLARRSPFGDKPFLIINQVRCEFSPILWLLQRKVPELLLERPQCWIVLNPEGQLNIADLYDRGGGELPAYRYRIRNAGIHVENQQHPAESRSFEIGSFHCQLDPQTGQAVYEADARLVRHEQPSADPSQVDSRFEIKGGMTVPKLHKQVDLAGGGTFSWDSLDLGMLPVRWIGLPAAARIAGLSSGQIHVNVAADLRLDFQLQTRINGFQTFDEQETNTLGLDQASLTARGRWNPSVDELVLSTFECDVPNLVWIEGRSDAGPPITISQRSAEPVRLHLAGILRDPAALWSRLFQNQDLQTIGTGTFDLRFVRGLDRNGLQLSVEADRMQVRWKDDLDLPKNQPKQIDLDLVFDEGSRELRVDRAHAAFAGLDVTVAGLFPFPAGDTQPIADTIRHVADRARIDGTLVLTEQADPVRDIPALHRWLPDLAVVGPARFACRYERGDDVGKLQAELYAEADSALSYPPVLDKPPGQPLGVRLEADLALQESGRLRRLRAELTHGLGKLAIESRPPGIRYAVVPRDDSADPLDHGRFHLAGAAFATLEHAETLWAVSPWLTTRLQESGKPLLTGNASANTDFDVSFSSQNALARVHCDLRADDLAVAVPTHNKTSNTDYVFRKTRQQRGTLAVDYRLEYAPDRTVHDVDGTLVLDGFRGSLTSCPVFSATRRDEATSGIRLEQAALRLQVTDMVSASAYLPRLESWAKKNQVTGGFQVAAEYGADSGEDLIEWQVDASALAFAPPTKDAPRKPGGLPARLSGTISLREENQDAERRAFASIRDVTGTLASCDFQIRSGQIHFADRWENVLRSLADANSPKLLVHDARFSLSSLAVFDASLRALSPALDRFASRYDLIGAAQIEAAYNYTPNGHNLRLVADASRANFQVLPHFAKSIGEPLLVRTTVHVPSMQDADTSAGWTVESFDATLADARAQLTGTIDWGPNGPPALDLAGCRLDLAVDVPDLARLARFSPRWADLQPVGSVNLTATVTARDGNVSADNAVGQFRNVELTLADSRLALNGGGEWNEQTITVDHAELAIDESRFQLAGSIEGPLDRARGRLAVHADLFDYDTVTTFASRCRKLYGPHETLSAEKRNAPSEGDEPLRRWLRLGRAAELDVDFFADRFLVTNTRSGKRHDVKAFGTNAALHDAELNIPFRCSLNGGLIEGTYQIDLADEDPAYDLRYEARDVQAAADTRPIIEDFFVGMTVEGKMTIVDRSHQYLFDKPGRPNHPVGSGEMIVENGTVVGRAAPLAITRIFPQLNLARYEFNRMRNWFVKYPDGRHDNRMIYIGSPYNLYVDGYSTTDGRIHYEVGLDLLARFNSKFWADTGQGRIPLFVKDGRVGTDGKLIKEAVTYLPPWRIAESLLVKNNVAYTAYLALRKQLAIEKDGHESP